MRMVPVQTALQMHAAVMEAVVGADLFVGCAAVADYRPEAVANQKLKKEQAEFAVQWVKNPDIISDVAALPNRPFVLGFAAETENGEAHARANSSVKI